jgi:hypothetical protein
MDKPETLATWVNVRENRRGNHEWRHWQHYYTGRRQTKQKPQHTKNNKMSNTDPTKHMRWTQVLGKGKKSLPSTTHLLWSGPRGRVVYLIPPSLEAEKQWPICILRDSRVVFLVFKNPHFNNIIALLKIWQIERNIIFNKIRNNNTYIEI